MDNCKAISNFVAVKYKHIGPKMAMAINNMEKPNITVPGVP